MYHYVTLKNTSLNFEIMIGCTYLKVQVRCWMHLLTCTRHQAYVTGALTKMYNTRLTSQVHSLG